MLPSGMTGKMVAEKMLHDYGITDVTVQSVKGKLTDHYNPVDKTLNLSEVTYNRATVAAAAVAANACGHAVQFGSNWSQWVLLAGMLLMGISNLVSFGQTVLLIGIVLFGLTTLFSFVTLPVEYNASSRALAWLDSSNITVGLQHDQAKDALNSAARTYVVAALSSLATLLYYVMIFLGRRD